MALKFLKENGYLVDLEFYTTENDDGEGNYYLTRIQIDGNEIEDILYHQYISDRKYWAMGFFRGCKKGKEDK